MIDLQTLATLSIVALVVAAWWRWTVMRER